MIKNTITLIFILSITTLLMYCDSNSSSVDPNVGISITGNNTAIQAKIATNADSDTTKLLNGVAYLYRNGSDSLLRSLPVTIGETILFDTLAVGMYDVLIKDDTTIVGESLSIQTIDSSTTEVTVYVMIITNIAGDNAQQVQGDGNSIEQHNGDGTIGGDQIMGDKIIGNKIVGDVTIIQTGSDTIVIKHQPVVTQPISSDSPTAMSSTPLSATTVSSALQLNSSVAEVSSSSQLFSSSLSTPNTPEIVSSSESLIVSSSSSVPASSEIIISSGEVSSSSIVLDSINTIESFSLHDPLYAFSYNGVIDTTLNEVSITIPSMTDLTTLLPNIVAKGTALLYDSTNILENLSFEMSAENGVTREYRVTIARDSVYFIEQAYKQGQYISVMNDSVIALEKYYANSVEEEYSFTVMQGLFDSDCTSFRARTNTQKFIARRDFLFQIYNYDYTEEFKKDATFCIEQSFETPGAIYLYGKNTDSFMHVIDSNIVTLAKFYNYRADKEAFQFYFKPRVTVEAESDPYIPPTYTVQNSPVHESADLLGSFSFEVYGKEGYYIANDYGILKIMHESELESYDQAIFNVEEGLYDASCVSFNSQFQPGYYFRHYKAVVVVHPEESSSSYQSDATWCYETGIEDSDLISFRAHNTSGYLTFIDMVGYWASSTHSSYWRESATFIRKNPLQ
ncbi:MAG: AbfB domain-containing protein [Fibrobacterales bacterium]